MAALTVPFSLVKLVRGGDLMENRPGWNWSGDPLRLPRVRTEELPALIGDRKLGATFCSGCGSTLEGSLVTRGLWAYCSIECAIRTERGDGGRRG